MKQKVNLKYWKCSLNSGNFGDELSPIVVNHFLNKEKYELTYNKHQESSIIAIGSYIQMAQSGDIIWGSGIRTDPPNERVKHSYNYLDVCAVRGPLTKKFLENRDIIVPDIFGDPGLLMPEIYKPFTNEECLKKIGILPHFSHKDNYNFLSSNYILIDPTSNYKDVINKITSCDIILSSSLHGLVIADAYSVPNVWLKEYPIQEGVFKFRDYFMSQGRDIYFINSVKEFEKSSMLFSDRNNIDLNLLKEAFPFS